MFKTVIYVPLVNHLTRKFMAATPVGARLATPIGAAVAAPMVAPETPGPRAALLLGQPADGLGDLCVFKHASDPSSEAVPSTTAFVGSVPYSKGKEAGTFHFPEDADEVPFRYAKQAFGVLPAPAAVKVESVPGGGLDGMTVDQLKAHAVEKGINLGTATKKADIIALIAAAPVA